MITFMTIVIGEGLGRDCAMCAMPMISASMQKAITKKTAPKTFDSGKA